MNFHRTLHNGYDCYPFWNRSKSILVKGTSGEAVNRNVSFNTLSIGRITAHGIVTQYALDHGAMLTNNRLHDARLMFLFLLGTSQFCQ